MIHMMWILMIITLVSSLVFRIVINNINWNSNELKDNKLSSLERTEEVISTINYYISNNMGVLEEVKGTIGAKKVNNTISIYYDRDKKKFVAILLDNGREELTLRDITKGKEVFLVPNLKV